MGKRREPRKDIKVPVRIFGTDSTGQIFSEKVFTVNISKQGIELSGLKAKPNIGEVVGVTYGTMKIHFRVKWIRQAETATDNLIGLLNITPEKPLWDFDLPAAQADEYRPATDRRKHPRLRCATSVELHPEGESLIWGKAADLSIGGCFVEMSIPLKQDQKIKIGLWIQEVKLWVDGVVTSSTPGFGIGVKFTEISEEDSKRLQQHLKTLSLGVRSPG
ncbi:MAG TPA: PilZ domain-containing protein [Terriglobales bacterium]|nr:PilZ domain-containing protein [Terriglobales bacterium]